MGLRDFGEVNGEEAGGLKAIAFARLRLAETMSRFTNLTITLASRPRAHASL